MRGLCQFSVVSFQISMLPKWPWEGDQTAIERPVHATIPRTNTYMVKHSRAKAGKPRYPGNGISKIFQFCMMGTSYIHFARAQ